MTMPTDDELSHARAHVNFAYDSLLLARFGRNKDFEYNEAVIHLNVALSFLGLQAVPLPPAGADRSIGMTAGDVE